MAEYLTNNLSGLINSIGLVFDIIGALLIWRFGLPQPVSRAGASYLLLEQTDQSQIDKAHKYDRYSLAGVVLLVSGFGLQLVSNFV